MPESEFYERIAKVRARFASKLLGKIRDTEAALQDMTGDGDAAVEAVALAYRRFHDVSGIGATIGFQATGQVARTLDAILVGPFRGHRGLSDDELARVKQGLDALCAAAQTELQSTDKDNRELAS